ncbi:serine/threonine-protein kinase [Gloeobacter violaceus]|uniref:Glr4072 protein n=1 Tax=Gloeobacter violaceus (strain ATCC 29082 / PCC 7421) TaxID=251221 RepID=Q7NE08_GLOVI|nr:serine/threonine-protein kinase [Gloeobacter violaceus]BAC92013.1 glr4072 [Gloeobacter violaceus PCC 7421]
MTPEQWKQIREALSVALDRQGTDRLAYLDALRLEPQLRQCLDKLLAAHDQQDGFLSTPILGSPLESLLANRSPTDVSWVAGRRLGAYRLVGELGRGGMGVVYLAERADGLFSKRVAIKVLQPGRGAPLLLERFVQERQILANLEHPHIARLIDGGTSEEGLPYLVMEYIDGEPIDCYCRKQQLPVRERLALIEKVCRAVHHAHTLQVLHRDLKASNILVDGAGEPKLLDFGIAKLLDEQAPEAEQTATEWRMLTPSYASPEQIRGEAAGPSSDVFSLGVVLYELLTARRPAGLNVGPLDEMLWTLGEQAAVPPSRAVAAGTDAGLLADPQKVQIDGSIDPLVLCALAKAPADRYTSALAMAEAIRGYLADHTPASGPLSFPPKAPRPALTGRLRQPAAIAAGIGVLAVSLGVGGFWWTSNFGSPASAAARTIAVLPFANIDGDSRSAYFSDGMTFDITNQLGKIADLTVIASSAAMQYRGTTKALREVARELGAGTILTGSVRRNGNRVRIVSQLVDPATGQQLWSQDYERQLKDVFAIQAEVSEQIARRLQARLSATEKLRLTQVPTASITAYDYYLKGRDYLGRRSRADNDLAIELFKRALALDPNYALAHAGLGSAYGSKATRYGQEERWEAESLKAIKKALVLDPNLSQAHKALGSYYYGRGRYRQALASFKRGAELNPSLPVVAGAYGGLSAAMGNLEEGVRWSKRSIALNPTRNGYPNLGMIYTILGEDARARRALEAAVSIQPDNVYALSYLSTLHKLRGQYDEARKTAQKILARDPQEVFGLTAAGDAERFAGRWSEAKAHYEKVLKITDRLDGESGQLQSTTILADIARREGQPTRAAQLLARSFQIDREAIDGGNEYYFYPFDLAAAYAVQGDKSSALRWLRRAIKAGWRDYRWLKLDPVFERLRGDGEFEQLVAQLKAQVEAMRQRVIAAESAES